MEIGSAFGFFLQAAERRGWSAVGFEQSAYAGGLAREKYGLNVINRDFLSEPIRDRFDVVCLLDTIEHVMNADALIEKAARSLKPGGGIYVTTGDIKSMHARALGRKWRLIAPPLHIFYYSPETISRLLAKHGFSVLSIRHHGKYFNLGSIVRHVSRLSVNGLAVMPVRIEPLDVMTVIARMKG